MDGRAWAKSHICQALLRSLYVSRFRTVTNLPFRGFMASQSLSARLQALSNTYRDTLTLIQRLQKLPSTPGTFSNSNSDPRLELSSEIHQSLKEQEDELETLRQEVDDATTSSSGGYIGGGSLRRRNSEQVHERERCAAMVARLGEDLKM